MIQAGATAITTDPKMLKMGRVAIKLQKEILKVIRL
jgi:hypothetical protein